MTTLTREMRVEVHQGLYDKSEFDVQMTGRFGFDSFHSPIYTAPNVLFLRGLSRAELESLILQLTGQLAKLDEEAKK